MTENSPENPADRKGEIRRDGWALAKAAHDAGEIKAVEVRASDYFGPGAEATAHLGRDFFVPLLTGGAAKVVGDPAQPHSWAYLTDIAATAVAALDFAGSGDESGTFRRRPRSRGFRSPMSCARNSQRPVGSPVPGCGACTGRTFFCGYPRDWPLELPVHGTVHQFREHHPRRARGVCHPMERCPRGDGGLVPLNIRSCGAGRARPSDPAPSGARGLPVTSSAGCSARGWAR